MSGLYFLMFCIILGFSCYSIFWQHFHSPNSMPYYPSWIYKPTLFVTLATCALSTFTYIRLFGFKWVKRYRFSKYVRFFEVLSYGINIASAIYLLSGVSVYVANLVLLANFLLFCIFALVFTHLCSDTWIGKANTALFCVITCYFCMLGYFSFTRDMLSYSFLMSLSHLLVNGFILTFCFLSLRFGHKELTAFFHLHSIDEHNIIRDIPKALSNDEFYVEYQPQVNIETNRVVGAEALIRWEHPTKGLIPPNQLISLAESIGMIDNITKWLIKVTVTHANLLRENNTPTPISINFSPLNFNLSMVHFLEKALKKHDLPAKYIIVEMTENLLLQENDEVKASLTKLNEMGVSVSIDDYGTGYSSLSYLKKMAIDELKIDRSFVADIQTNKDNYEIVRSTLDMAKNLSLHVVAEGVEDDATKDILKQLGCTTAQGFGIAKPMSGESLIRWISEQYKQSSSQHI